MSRAVLLVVCVLGLACGGEGDGGGDPGAPIAAADRDMLCGQFTEHATACGWGGNVNNADWNCGDAAVVWREDVFREFTACAIGLSCDGDGQSCYAALTDTSPLAIHEEYGAECERRSTECQLSPMGDGSILLLSCDPTRLATYASPVIEAVLACLDQPCADVVPCLDDVL